MPEDYHYFEINADFCITVLFGAPFVSFMHIAELACCHRSSEWLHDTLGNTLLYIDPITSYSIGNGAVCAEKFNIQSRCPPLGPCAECQVMIHADMIHQHT